MFYFKSNSIEYNSSENCKMNDIINKFLLAGEKFIPEMHLKQPGFTYSACGPFTKNKERIQKFKQIGNSRCIYKNQLDKAGFQHDMVYRDFKDLERSTASDKVLKEKAFSIAKNPKYDGYQRGLASMVSIFFDKKTSGGAIAMPQNEQLAEELHKSIIRKFKERKEKYKKGITIVNDFQQILKNSNEKPNKIWVDKGSEFFNSSFKKWLQDKCIQHIMKENLLLLKDLLELYRIKFTNT